jgi:hypothetical protein
LLQLAVEQRQREHRLADADVRAGAQVTAHELGPADERAVRAAEIAQLDPALIDPQHAVMARHRRIVEA